MEGDEDGDELFLDGGEHLGDEEAVLVLLFEELSSFADVGVEGEDFELD